jgi:NADH-quinone oxidoreductase subunit I
MTASTVKVKRRAMDLSERLFLKEILRGLLTTNRHFWRNWFRRQDTATLNYPEETRPYPERWRGLHRLMHREDGSVRCVACMLCATHCPADCITIEGAEHPDISCEKVALSFDIDLLKCIYCGMCEEACPCDAIRLDTGLHAKPVFRRCEAIITLPELLSRGALSEAKQGGRNL